MQEHASGQAAPPVDNRDVPDGGPPPAPEQPPAALAPVSPGSPSGRTLGIAAVVGAVAVAALAVGLAIGGGAPRGSGAQGVDTPGAAQARVPISDAGWTSPDGRTGIRLDNRGFGGRGGAFGRSSVSITAIDGSRLSLRTDDGWTRTIDASGATITRGGARADLSALRVGDRISFREKRNDDGTYKITAIDVVQPSVAGTVSKVAGSTVTVRTRDGERTILLTGSTTYRVGAKAGTKDAVVVGARIIARGTLGSDGTLTASSVTVVPATTAGTVKEKGPGSITITLRDGSTRVVKVDSSTTLRVAGVSSPTLADVAVGAVVMATGTANADGSLTAALVVVMPAGRDGLPGMGGPWFGGHGGFPGWHGTPVWPELVPVPTLDPSGGSSG